jgi:hypothetical protein
MLIALDTETTGLDHKHRARPFYVTVCDDKGEITFWEWPVDPRTRMPQIDRRDLTEIRSMIHDAERVVGQNLKFDVMALQTIGITHFPWDKAEDTLIAGHILASNLPHNLTDMTLQYLGVNIEPLEEALHGACQAARRWCRSHAPDWMLAKAGLSGMPSAKGECWKYDTWLPRRVAQFRWESHDEAFAPPSEENPSINIRGESTHPWWLVLREYSNADSSATMPLWQAQMEEMYSRGYEKIYRHRMLMPELIWDMENYGLTANRKRARFLRAEYADDSERAGRLCVNIAASMGYQLEMPRNGTNRSLREFLFAPGVDGRETPAREVAGDLGEIQGETLKLPYLKTSKKTGVPSLDKAALEAYESLLPEKSRGLSFVRALRSKRKRDTAISYLESYEHFWLPIHSRNGHGGDRQWLDDADPQKALAEVMANDAQEWFRLYPTLNCTGTSTLRWSSSNPNEQNVSKQMEKCRHCDGKGVMVMGRGGSEQECLSCHGQGELSLNLRYVFGPAPGREWWTMDAKNIELRIPAYEAGEEEMIRLFEKADEPPYYGSNHLLNFHTVYPDVWDKELREVGLDKVGPHCKKKYASSLYHRAKCGGFAVQYGAVEILNGWGTADRAFGRQGAHALLKQRFRRIHGPGGLNEWCIKTATKQGYIETLPDRKVDPKRGYPLLCTRTENGRILPTVPLNYRVQGSCCWALGRMMVLARAKLREWRETEGFDGHLILYVHDEVGFDFPFRANKGNLDKAMELKKIMETVGDDLIPRIPLVMGVEYHVESWAEGETCA